MLTVVEQGKPCPCNLWEGFGSLVALAVRRLFFLNYTRLIVTYIYNPL